MNIELIREIIPRLKAQLEKTALDRNYAQLERVSVSSFILYNISVFIRSNNIVWW